MPCHQPASCNVRVTNQHFQGNFAFPIIFGTDQHFSWPVSKPANFLKIRQHKSFQPNHFIYLFVCNVWQLDLTTAKGEPQWNS